MNVASYIFTSNLNYVLLHYSIFSYHHYHSKAWELLLCFSGEASVQFGGKLGPMVTVAKGDLVLVPPGLAHKQLDDKNGFSLLGSYPAFNRIWV